jgi:signal transduction histidine kinase
LVEKKVLERTGELNIAMLEQEKLHGQLAHAQKLESIGHLAAGVAHEINTPIQFVTDNAHFLKDSFAEICVLLRAKGSLLASIKEENTPIQNSRNELENIDVSYLIQEIPAAIEQSIEGLQRITKIVRAMKEFSYTDTEAKVLFNVNQAIQNTIQVSKSEWKTIANIKVDLDESLPEIPGYPADMRQVILNMIINAAHAVASVQSVTKQMGEIAISTSSEGNNIKIQISDTGAGIPNLIRSKIFDPFFTTKEIGKGTGQGLAICHSIIVKKHNGIIILDSEVGKGTVFTILLPKTVENLHIPEQLHDFKTEQIEQ